MGVATFIWYVLGLILLLILLQVLATPLQLLVRIAGSSILGGFALWGINLAGSFIGFHLGLNPVSAAIAGMLGIPGVMGLGILRMILG